MSGAIQQNYRLWRYQRIIGNIEAQGFIPSLPIYLTAGGFATATPTGMGPAMWKWQGSCPPLLVGVWRSWRLSNYPTEKGSKTRYQRTIPKSKLQAGQEAIRKARKIGPRPLAPTPGGH